jgi:hypothetical protein
MEVRKMAEKKYKYKAEIKQPQTVVDVKLDPKGGGLSEREYKTVKKDVYGASLLEKGLLIVEEAPPSAPAPNANAALAAAAVAAAEALASSNEADGDGASETVPDFDAKDKPEDQAGWRPE